MNFVISYDQARRLDYAEMEPYKRICTWACDNPQMFFDKFKRELQGGDDSKRLWKALDRETAEGALEMASDAITVLEGAESESDNPTLAKKIETLKEIAQAINELHESLSTAQIE